jgi:hypothetical protein
MVKNNQNILDFTLEKFGTLENLFNDVLVPNNLSADSEIKPNQDININTFEKGNKTVKDQIQTLGLILTNGELEGNVNYEFEDSINYEFEDSINYEFND